MRAGHITGWDGLDEGECEVADSVRVASGGVLVDPQAVHAIASRLRTSATTLGDNAKLVRANTFGPAQAGTRYAEQGQRIHDGLVRIESWLLQWQEASGALAEAVGQTVVVLGETDAEAARKVANT
ncbi:hypothetical protein DFR76_108282 [Nocardia pseudobrasiliensis]|uniref:Excreted virulence factor EspC (Type VII ESX diderm) n=1 Tax=Nocardia pseudobrasiliensis TaxID=45979 RepID=A0A370I144_9NOCA|nr:hypothetical protein DFR76_108282 [Nocardia pseudobrasiliensis]